MHFQRVPAGGAVAAGVGLSKPLPLGFSGFPGFLGFLASLGINIKRKFCSFE